MSGSVVSAAFPDTPDAPRLARHWVAEAVTQLQWPGPVDQLMLLVSELVTNAVLYTGDNIGLTVYVHECGIWVSVADDGTGRVTAREHAIDSTGGRGLEIVDKVSGTWGVITERAGKSVWFEMGDPDHTDSSFPG